MTEVLKKLPIYPLFLRLRPRFLSDDRLKAKLAKKSHNLDKTLADDSDNRLYLCEVKALLKEYFRRRIKGSDVSKWAWDLVYQAESGASEAEMGQARPDDAALARQDVCEAIRNRRSIRQWDETPVTRDEVTEALDVARWAPCSCNRQVWKFLVVNTPADKEPLKRFTHQTFFLEAPAIIVALVDTGDYHGQIKHYAYLDSGAVIQNLLLALHAKSLGACWIGVKHDREFDSHLEQFRAYFDLPENLIPVSLIPVGHYSQMPKVPARKDVADLLIDRMA